MRPSLTALLVAVALATPAALIAQDTVHKTPKTQKAPKLKRNPDLISVQEIEALPADVRNAYEVVSRLRPTWLKTRGPSSFTQGNVEVAAYVNEVRRGGPSALEEVDRLQIAEIRHLRGSEASARFGTNHENGAILVKLK